MMAGQEWSDLLEALLKAAEVSELTGLSLRHVQRLTRSGQYPCEVQQNSQNRPVYLIPLSALPEQAQVKYWKNTKAAQSPVGKTTGAAPQLSEPLEHFTIEERQEISFWLQTIQEWQDFRASLPEADKIAADNAYTAVFHAKHPEIPISRGILYRRQRAIRENDLRALTDTRGKGRRGCRKISEDVWQAFLYYYLDEAQHPIQRCYEYTAAWAEQYAPELLPLPDYTTFYRHVKADVPMAVTVLGREGEKAFRDRCGMYIRRVYDDMHANEWWIADNHTFDVITQDGSGNRHRLYLTAFFDARSGIFTGCYVTDAPSSQSTLIALRRGILKYGIPENIYVDNGREFLTYDVGGLGHRAKKSQKEEFSPPPVFERLGIRMTNAIVRNAKAKIIERRFRDVKDQLSRLFDSFCGGNVVEKPERLKHVIKDGRVVLDGNFTEAVETLLEGYFNESAYGGAVAEDRGKPRMQVWQENLKHQRVPRTPEDLNLMLMRSSRAVKVGRNGVTANLYGLKLDYGTDLFTLQYQGRQVYYRFDPDDLRTIRAYTLEDVFIAELPARSDMVQKYGASRESLAEAMRQQRQYEKLVKNEKTRLTARLLETYGKHSALELMIANAQQNLQARIVASERAYPASIELVSAYEEPMLKVAGEESSSIDFDRLIANSAKHNGGIADEDL